MGHQWMKPLQKTQQPEWVSSKRCCKGTAAEVTYRTPADDAHLPKLRVVILITWENRGGEGGENS